MLCVDFKGNKYNSVAKMCEAYKISYRRFIRSLHNGCSQKEALLGEKKKLSGLVDYKGFKYPSVTAMCLAYSKDVEWYIQKIARGETNQDILTEIVTLDKMPKVVHEKVMVVTKEVYLKRIERGWNEDEARTIPVNSKKTFTIKGVEYKSVKELCKANNFNYPLFLYYKKLKGLNEAFEILKTRLAIFAQD